MLIGCITEQELSKFVHNLDNLPHICYRPCCAAAVKLARQNCTHARKHLFDITAKTIGCLKQSIGKLENILPKSVFCLKSNITELQSSAFLQTANSFMKKLAPVTVFRWKISLDDKPIIEVGVFCNIRHVTFFDLRAILIFLGLR